MPAHFMADPTQINDPEQYARLSRPEEPHEQPSPSDKAQHTDKWARTMTKWLITWTNRKGAKWQLLDFCGKNGSEAVGIVDLMAIRKDHRNAGFGHKKGDLFEIVVIQTKGGSAPWPSEEDNERLSRVASRYGARAVLSQWRRKETLTLYELEGKQWKLVQADEIFG